MDAWFILEAALLQGSCGDDALADGGTGFARGFAGHLVEIDGLHLDLQVDAVQQRARDFAHVVGALILVADAFLLGMPIIAAGARIHRSHEHERGGILGRILGARNSDHPILQRLAHHLQHVSRKFWQLIQMERLAPFPFAI